MINKFRFKDGTIYWNIPLVCEQKDFTNKDMLFFQKNSMICRWQAGERQTYCNVNYVILGYIIKKITGLEYGEYLKDKVLIPLGMLHSNFNQKNF